MLKRRRYSKCGSYLTSLKSAYRRSKVKVVYDSSSDSDSESFPKKKPQKVEESFDVKSTSTRSSVTQTVNTTTYTIANIGSASSTVTV